MGSPALRTSRTLLGCASDAFVSTYHGGDRARRAAWNIGRVHSHSGTGPPGDVGGKSSSFVRSLLAKQERRRHSFPTERAELLWNRCPGLPQKAGAPASSRAFQSRAISWSIVDRIKALHTIRAPGPVKEKIGFVGNTKGKCALSDIADFGAIVAIWPEKACALHIFHYLREITIN